MVCLNIVLNFILMQFLQHRGLALSTSITAMVNFIILLKLIHKQMPHIDFSGIFPNVVKTLIISVIMFFFLIIASHFYTAVGLGKMIVKVIILSVLSLGLFYVLGLWFKLDYLKEAGTSLWKKFQKK